MPPMTVVFNPTEETLEVFSGGESYHLPPGFSRLLPHHYDPDPAKDKSVVSVETLLTHALTAHHLRGLRVSSEAEWDAAEELVGLAVIVAEEAAAKEEAEAVAAEAAAAAAAKVAAEAEEAAVEAEAAAAAAAKVAAVERAEADDAKALLAGGSHRE